MDNDPNTLDEIQQTAAELIRRWPTKARPVVVEVEVPGLRSRTGRAEVYRAWPVGEFRYHCKDSNIPYQLGITADGKQVELKDVQPSVTLTNKMRWHDPVKSPSDHQWKVRVLSQLQRELEALTAEDDAGGGPHAEAPQSRLVGRTLTRSDSLKLSRLVNDLAQTRIRYRNIYDLYGTSTNPKAHGSPSWHVRKRWRELERLQRQNDSLIRTRVSITGVPEEPVSLAASCEQERSGR